MYALVCYVCVYVYICVSLDPRESCLPSSELNFPGDPRPLTQKMTAGFHACVCLCVGVWLSSMTSPPSFPPLVVAEPLWTERLNNESGSRGFVCAAIYVCERLHRLCVASFLDES